MVKFISICAWYPDRKDHYGVGWYFEEYNPITKEGRGYFGRYGRKDYLFERKVFDGELCERTCGFGKGCFWSEWRGIIESV